MHIERIKRFMEIYYPGIENYWNGKPRLALHYKPKFQRHEKELSALDVSFFVIHRVTSVTNDEWEIKGDAIFVTLGDDIYLLRDLPTNYEEKIKFDQSSYGFDFSLNEINIKYEEHSQSHGTKFLNLSIPRDEWGKVDLLLCPFELPKNYEVPEGFLQALIGEKFPLQIAVDIYTACAYRTKNGSIMLPVKAIAETLAKSFKDEAMFYYQNYGEMDHILLKKECFKLE